MQNSLFNIFNFTIIKALSLSVFLIESSPDLCTLGTLRGIFASHISLQQIPCRLVFFTGHRPQVIVLPKLMNTESILKTSKSSP